MRLNKFMADCGVGSRRACDEIIKEGRVKVDNKAVASLGMDIDEINSRVYVDGKRLQVKRLTYIMLHKPKGCVSTVKDDKGRKTVLEFVDLDKRLYPVGRLDFDTEGLLLLTNDGELTYKLTHPKHEIYKTYIARIEGKLTPDEINSLKDGMDLDGEKTLPAIVNVLENDEKHQRIEISIREGKNRQVKRMFEKTGKTVVFLKRTKIGEISLGGLARGAWRYLNEKELDYLREL